MKNDKKKMNIKKNKKKYVNNNEMIPDVICSILGEVYLDYYTQ